MTTAAELIGLQLHESCALVSAVIYNRLDADMPLGVYVRKPDKLHHFFTADADEFCRKAREYGYSC